MHFILHSETDEISIAERMGHADYRYYFVLKAFRPALEKIGSVEVVHAPSDQVDKIYDRRTADGEECVFFFFGPPHKAPLDLRCPTVIVIAWEYSTLPNEIWDERARSDWRVTLAALDGTIALCEYTAQTIKSVMGGNYPVAVVNGALWERFAAMRKTVVSRTTPASVEFRVRGTVFDTARLDLSADRLIAASRPEPVAEEDISDEHKVALANSEPLVDWLDDLLSEPTSLRKAGAQAESGDVSVDVPVRLDGIVYTTVLDPVSDRKNLHDLVTAFCFAFRFIEDATLVLKIVHYDEKVYRDGLLLLLSRLAPLKCRVVVIHAFLDDEAMGKLIGATSYYVNASYCEALCQSLMEFMSFGKPAIAPLHTAMRDYIDDEVAFIPASAREFSMWPNDPRQMWRCDRFRLDWEALRDAYLESYQLAKSRPDAYAAMGQRAMTRIRERSSAGEASQKISTYLEERRVRDTSRANFPFTLANESP